MATVTVTPQREAVVAGIFIAAPPGRIFEALIDPIPVRRRSEKDDFELAVWEMDPQVGGFWQSVSKPRPGKGDPKLGFGHRVKILQIDPPRLLVHTWLANWHDDPKHETIVRWDLAPTETRRESKSRTAACHP